MRIKRFVAADMRTALRMVRDEHGPDAVILSNKPVHGGIEVVAATDYDEAFVQQALRSAAESEPAPERPATALDALPAFDPAPLPVAPRTVVRTEAKSGSRADAMIAALAGNSPQAAAARSALAERARAAVRDAGTPAPALSALLREPATVATEPAPVAPAAPAAPVAGKSGRPGDDFRALLRRLTETEAPAPKLSARAVDMAQAEAEYVQTRAQANVEAAPTLDEPVAIAPVAEPEIIDVEPVPVAQAARIARPAPAPAIEVVPAAVAPTFAEFVAPLSVAVAPRPQPVADAFDALAEMAAVQAPAPVAAPQVVTVAAPPTLQLVVNQSDDPTIVAMRNELASMRQMIERQMDQFAVERLRGSPARALAFETLQAYGFDDALAQQVASRIDPKLDPARVKAPLLAELARMLTVARAEPFENGGVFALVGPTGAGKTTTLAKLAARFAQQRRARDVALVTTDIERAGAREQLHALGRRLGITVCEADGPEALGDTLDQLADYPLVLVDTAGYAARDKALLGQVTWLRATRNLRSLLVLPANLQPQDLSEAVRRYRMAQPEAVVLTKLDETGHLGGALSVAIKHGLSLAYTTAGQQVPADVEVADASRLVLQLERLRRAADNPLATEERHVVA